MPILEAAYPDDTIHQVIIILILLLRKRRQVRQSICLKP